MIPPLKYCLLEVSLQDDGLPLDTFAKPFAVIIRS